MTCGGGYWPKVAYNEVEIQEARMVRLCLGFAFIVLLSPAATANDASIVGAWTFQSFFREVTATGERAERIW